MQLSGNILLEPYYLAKHCCCWATFCKDWSECHEDSELAENFDTPASTALPTQSPKTAAPLCSKAQAQQPSSSSGLFESAPEVIELPLTDWGC